MTRLSKISNIWLGLCRRAPLVHTTETTIRDQPEPVLDGQPDGGAGGAGTMRRGVGILISGSKTLIRNRQLFWFTVLSGLVLTGHFLAQGALMVAGRNNGGNVLIASPVITFLLEFPTVFCLVFLLAGLVLSLSSKKEGPILFFRGQGMAVQYLKPLAGWSMVIALIGTILFTLGLNMDLLQPAALYRPFNIFGELSVIMLNVLHQFPFSWSLNPDTYIPYGTFSRFLEAFRFGLAYAMILFVINILLFAVTLFVVPQIVLEKKPLKEAVFGSFLLMKNIRNEVAASLLGLGIIVLAALLTFFLFQFTGIDHVTGLHIASTRPSDAWIGFGLLYIIALTGFVFVAATIGGIATLELYKDAKIRGSVK
jgi:hypothetical protein